MGQSLVEILKERQGARSQEEFAEDLNIAQPTLSRIYSGDRGIGKETARRIVKRYPDLVFAVSAVLLANDMPIAQVAMPDGNSKEPANVV